MAEKEIMQEEQEQQGLTYGQEVAAVINAQYSIDDQIALLRQKDTKPEEWAKFNAFAEEVKGKVKESRGDE